MNPEEIARILAQPDVDEDELPAFKEGDKILFGIFEEETFDHTGKLAVQMVVSLVEEKFWAENNHIPSVHVLEELEALGIELPEYLSEEAENMLVVYIKRVTREQVIRDLTALGFHYDEDFNTFLNDIEDE